MSEFSLLVQLRFIPEKLRRRQSCEECVWVYLESQKARALQSMLLGK